MAINKGLEKQIIKEGISAMINNDESIVENRYEFYIKYTKQYPRQYDERLQSLFFNFYSIWKISKINSTHKK